MAEKKKFDFSGFLEDLKKEPTERTLDTKTERQYFLIVSEGEKTEPQYFQALSEQLPNHAVQIEIKGEGKNTISVVDVAIAYKNARKADKLNPDFDEVWVVFDKDDFPDQNFNKAIRKAEQEGIKAAYSNEAFELWYVLHFQYLDAAITRNQYISILRKQMGKYEKNDPDIYHKLQEHENSDEEQAIKNAEKLFQELNQGKPAKDKPITKVYQLVVSLNRFKE